MIKVSRIWVAMLAGLAPLLALAATVTAPVVGSARLEAVAARIKGATAADLRATPVPGIFEYRRGAELAYVSEDGRFAFAGDLYQLSDKANLSDSRRRELRLALVKAVPESSMVVFSPKETRFTVSVFTDVDCGYCRTLHKQIAEYNKLGIKVRYLSFPRSGPNTESWATAEKVWCSKDRKAALTQAKLGQELSAPTCSPNPVAAQYALGRSMGLEGTPGIVTDTGDLLPGYLPPAELLKQLQADAQLAQARK